MASSCCRGKGDGRSMFKSKTPRFIKLISEDTVGKGRLRIPRKFTNEFGSELPNFVILKVPNGRIWAVELVKCDAGEVWFQNGWSEFEEFYTLDHGSSLVLKYQGNNLFHVRIYDQTTCEIEYPFSVNGIGKADISPECGEPMMGRNGDDHVSVQVPDAGFPSTKKRDKSSLPSPRPTKEMRTSLATNYEGTSEFQMSARNVRGSQPVSIQVEACLGDVNPPCPKGQSEARRGNRQVSGQEHSLHKVSLKSKVATPDGKANALNRATSAFNSENPFFMVYMHPSYVNGCQLHVPQRFMRKHFKKQYGNVVLHVPDGQTLYVELREGQFCNGWRKFVQDNSVRVGDVCVFEMLKGCGDTLNVFISRVGQDANNPPPQGEVWPQKV